MMPNTSPAIDNAGVVRSVLESARRTRIGPGIYTTGAITKGRKGEELAGIAGMKAAGAVMLTDDGFPVDNPQVLRRAMEYAREFDIPLASHCEVKELSGKGCMHEGKISYALGLPGIPAISEEICIARDIRLAEFTGVHLNIQHVSTERGMGTIKRAKDRGIRVTCEIAPHHLMFNHEHIGDYDTHYKMNPPLRTPEDNAALLQGLKDGWFDVIATDHAPHTPFEKNQDFASAPFGITGLETALVSLYDHYIRKGHPRLGPHREALQRRTAPPHETPARADPRRRHRRVHPLQSRPHHHLQPRLHEVEEHQNTPFLDQTLPRHGRARGLSR
jgi:dihydroorotase